MNLTIGSKSMKVFAKTLRYMAKYSNDLYIQAHEDYLVCKVVNSSQTVLCQSKFENVFFVKYKPSDTPEDNFAKVPFRPLLNCVKNCKTISGCYISIDTERDRLIVSIKKESGIEATHKIYLMEQEELEDLPPDQNLSEVTCHPTIFKRLQGSSSEIRELHLQFKEKTVLVENFIENSDEECRTVRLHYLLDYTEFLCYDVKREVSLVFAWTDFNNIVDMAQQIECDLRIRFSNTGKPLIVILDTGTTYSIQLIVMTLSHENSKNQRKNSKVVTYKDVMSDYVQDKGLEIGASQLERILSPSIQTSGSCVQGPQNNTTPIISEQEMDIIAASLAHSKTLKFPNVNESFVNLSQRERQEVEDALRDFENCESMDVDPPVIDPPIRPQSVSAINLDTYRLQASKENLAEMAEIRDEVHTDFQVSDIESHHIIPSNPKMSSNIETESNNMEIHESLSSEERSELKKIQSIFKYRPNTRLKNVEVIYPGSDSEESYHDEN